MSEEYDSNNAYYSPFWPIMIVLIGFILWLSVQVVYLVEQQVTAKTELTKMGPTLQRANVAQTRLLALLKDLAQTSAKDPYAAQIMKEAENAGLIQVRPNNTNETASPAAPTTSADSSADSLSK